MLTQNLVLEYLSKSAGQTVEANRNVSFDEKQFPKFNQVLDNSIDRIASRENRGELSGQSRKETAENGIRNNSTIKSYRDLVRAKEQNTQPKREDVKLAVDDTDERLMKKASKAARGKNAPIEESFAAVLGMTPEEFGSILLQLGINPQDLSDAAKTDEIASKIAGLFGLDTDEEKTLSQILAITQKIAEELKQNAEAMAEIKTEEGIDNKAIVTDGEIGPAEEEPKVQEPGIKLKEVLKEIKDKTGDKPELLAESISQKLKCQKSDISLDAAQDSDSNTVKGINEESDAFLEDSSEEKKVLDRNIPDKDAGSKEERDESNWQDDDIKLDALNRNTGEKVQQQEPAEFEIGSTAYMENQKADGIDKVSVVEKQAPVNRKEIVAQVVEKAKVLLDGDKSEMVINLKPDHLGKLELKVVTERGIVIAKFVAESEQVKAALEANMDTLKQSLEKQGFSVQGFSVSVGKDNQRGYNPNSEYLRNRLTGGSKGKSEMVQRVNSAAYSEGRQIINPYEWGDSSINLTA